MLKEDKYKIIKTTMISDVDKNIVFKLYTPLMGPLASLLYLFFYEKDTLEEKISYIMSSLKMTLPQVTIARESLEALGLIKTYQKDDDYLFVLYKPESPKNFFNNPLFNVSLYNNVGSKAYNKLIEYYKIKKVDTSKYEDITASFDDIFESSKKGFVMELEEEVSNKLYYKENLDIDLIKAGLPEEMYKDTTFDRDVIYLLNTLAHIYKLDSIEMTNLLKANLENKKVNEKKLREDARDLYKFNNYGSMPTIVHRKTRDKTYLESSSKEDTLLKTFKENSPHDYLSSRYKNGSPSERELKILERLLVDYKFKPEVANVLISYVLMVNNEKFTAGFVDAVATQWNRLGIDSAEKAMEVARKETNKKKNKTSRYTKKAPIKPEWTGEKIESDDLSLEDQELLKDLLA